MTTTNLLRAPEDASAGGTRVAALAGLALFVPALLGTFLLMLIDAYEPGDGAMGGPALAGLVALVLSLVPGSAVAVAPGGTFTRRTRTTLLWLQYGLLAAGPLLALAD
ncbi:hypothetical protein [Streptomyces sp. NPDC059452]|uniref:hypothetical protein n=1 Tax=Streptomyces sp. NPDC059452 TaxID=3346835 RepID=UPI0036C1D650